MAAAPRRFFRVVKTNPPSLNDFLSNVARGIKPPDEDAETLRLWLGVSVYATAAQARRMARRYPRHGAFIAHLEVEAGAPVRFERTLSTPGHHTMWAMPAYLITQVVAVERL